MYYGDIVRTLKKKKDNKDTIHLIKSSLHFLVCFGKIIMQFIGERYRVSTGAGPGFDRGLTGAVFLDQTI